MKQLQLEKLKPMIIDLCNRVERRTFSLKELYAYYKKNYKKLELGGETPDATIRRLLQELGKENFLIFVDNHGHYTLKNFKILEVEKEDLKNIDISNESPEMRDYLLEIYVRKAKWSTLAKEKYGMKCLYKECKNTFLKEDGESYIEVHHIIPLCDGGADAIWNLSVLCAHHHRMAHFADKVIKDDIKNYLLNNSKRKKELEDAKINAI